MLNVGTLSANIHIWKRVGTSMCVRVYFLFTPEVERNR